MQMSTVQHWDWEILPARHCGNHASPGIFWVIFLRCSNSTYASLPDVVPYGEVFHRQSPFSLPGCCVLNFDICVRSLWAKSMHFYGSKSYAYGFRCGNCSWDTPSAKPCGLVKAQQGPCHRTLHDWFPYPPKGSIGNMDKMERKCMDNPWQSHINGGWKISTFFGKSWNSGWFANVFQPCLISSCVINGLVFQGKVTGTPYSSWEKHFLDKNFPWHANFIGGFPLPCLIIKGNAGS